MNLRKVTSLTAFLSFILMVLTSIILYIVPQGRVAYWADWTLWGLNKTEWGNIHINLGFLFLIALFLHIYYNWKPLINYLKSKTKELTVLTPNFNAALIVTIAFIVGTYFLLPPFSWIISFNDYFKDSGAKKYGEPPYGHAELSSIKTFAQKMNLDLAKSMELLREAGYPVEESTETLQTIGKRYNIPPQKIYDTIKPPTAVVDQSPNTMQTMPDAPPPGTGNLTLADLCSQYDLNVKMVLRELKERGITATADLTLKQIAEKNQTNPIDLYDTIKMIRSHLPKQRSVE